MYILRQPYDDYLQRLIKREAELFHLLYKDRKVEFGHDDLSFGLSSQNKANIYEDQLAQVNEALTALEEGTYGVCIICGGMIEQEILQKVPEANRCLEHQFVRFLYE